MTESGFLRLKSEVFQLLRSGLSPALTYHSIGHTEDVLKHVERIAAAEDITDTRLLLLMRIAAIFHDTGFVRTYRGHEEESCRIMGEILDKNLFEPDEISLMEAMIMATKIPQSPHSLPEMILCDADLDYLGRTDFYEISDTLKEEFFAYNIISSEKQWDQLQVSFFESHRYFTPSSLLDRYPLKKKHYERLRLKLN